MQLYLIRRASRVSFDFFLSGEYYDTVTGLLICWLANCGQLFIRQRKLRDTFLLVASSLSILSFVGSIGERTSSLEIWGKKLSDVTQL